MSFRRLVRRLIFVSEDGRGDVLAHLDHLGRQVEALQHLVDGLGAHAGIELVTVLLDRVEVGFVREQLAALHFGHARVDHDEGFEIQHALDLAQRHVQHEADARRQRLQEPDVRGRARELDVAHALAAHLGLRHFDAALLADDAAVLQALVLAAETLVVLDGPEDLRAEQAVAFRLERAVVDGFRLLDFAERPGPDHLRGSERDADRVEVLDRRLLLEQLQQVFHWITRSVVAATRTAHSFSWWSSMLMPSDRISFTSTLKDSGMPASIW